MRKVSKKVVKETTTGKKVKTVTTLHEKVCHCNSFSCLDKLKSDNEMTIHDDKSISFSQEKTHERNGEKLIFKMHTVIRPIEVVDGNNIIQVEKTLIEEIIKAETPKSEKLDLKGILDMMAGKSRPNASQISDMVDMMVQNMGRKDRMERHTPTANEMNEIMKSILGNGKLPDNIKVIAMGKVNGIPSFEEFMDMIKKSE